MLANAPSAPGRATGPGWVWLAFLPNLLAVPLLVLSHLWCVMAAAPFIDAAVIDRPIAVRITSCTGPDARFPACDAVGQVDGRTATVRVVYGSFLTPLPAVGDTVPVLVERSRITALPVDLRSLVDTMGLPVAQLAVWTLLTLNPALWVLLVAMTRARRPVAATSSPPEGIST